MRFLIDENLSPRLTDLLAEEGHDAIHVRDFDAAGARDIQVALGRLRQKLGGERAAI